MVNIIEVNNLVKKYGDLTAVNGISFSVREGEVFGILGPNGAGKTTTLEMIEGLKGITSGSVSVDGHDVATSTHAVKAIIGVQLQSSSFFQGLNLVELLDIFGALYGRRVNAMELLTRVQLQEKAKAGAKELSGGQKQRLSIAVALVNAPRVVFLDEPTTGLDPQARRNLWDLVTSIKADGTTVVLTTHYMEEAEVLCDRVAIMDHAKIIALDTTTNLIKKAGTSSTIHFHVDKPCEVSLLRSLPAVEAVIAEDHSYQLTTTDAQLTLPALFLQAHEEGFSLKDLQLKQATLEDVFLKLTGHTLRD
ncbi:MAG: ABC transporter [Candidatus Doudnabacteria bacterium RIFCSPHIGHO2_01_FULL_50_11]|uniref:ABC transporter n=1 Tax=Candidatus Doudnabacteria bacterium RIFCSPHIGHO2_01_FULL_50_11 TaxID=1817828 RepID=A0A1F5PIU7_9BACT|nr:MAG: ABC transporter [Candidatus Doudnabacteria bacterium RIFCSPHIGHO2_01_FULL_50_11]